MEGSTPKRREGEGCLSPHQSRGLGKLYKFLIGAENEFGEI